MYEQRPTSPTRYQNHYSDNRGRKESPPRKIECTIITQNNNNNNNHFRNNRFDYSQHLLSWQAYHQHRNRDQGQGQDRTTTHFRSDDSSWQFNSVALTRRRKTTHQIHGPRNRKTKLWWSPSRHVSERREHEPIRQKCRINKLRLSACQNVKQLWIPRECKKLSILISRAYTHASILMFSLQVEVLLRCVIEDQRFS